MFIEMFQGLWYRDESIDIKLPSRNLKVDPRANFPQQYKFHAHYHDDGFTVTLTRTDDHIEYLLRSFTMRVYDPAKEIVPNFDSKIYTYSGIDGEYAPLDTVVGIIDQSVKTIQKNAFFNCKMMKRCIMYDGLETIREQAFSGCVSLDAIFLPSSLKKVELDAFIGCWNIKFLSHSLDIDIRSVGTNVVRKFNVLLENSHIQEYKYGGDQMIKGDRSRQLMPDLHRNLPTLHRMCLDANISFQAIRDCIKKHGTAVTSITDHGGMTPLHILTMNPHADVESIQECFDANESALFVGDKRGKTPLDYLRRGHSLEVHNWLVKALCIHRDGMVNRDEMDEHRSKRRRIN